MEDRKRRSRRAVAAALLFAAATGCQSPPESADPVPVPISEAPVLPDTSARTVGAGRVVDGPARITEFRPRGSAVTVNARTVDLRRVFDDLGPEATLWYQHVQTLANPFFGGREPATRGAELAAEYIEFYFRHYNLEPAFDDDDATGAGTEPAGSYVQPFSFTVSDRFDEVTVAHAAVAIDGEPLAAGEDFAVLGNSGSGEVTAPLTFVGYGIEGGPDGYDSFGEATDLTGRIALLLRYTPLDGHGEFRWSERRRGRHAALARKMRRVVERGAAAILLVNPPGAPADDPVLEPVKRSRRFGPGLDVPAVHVTPEVADRLLRHGAPPGAAGSEPAGLSAWRRRADRGAVGSVRLDDALRVTVEAAVERHRNRRTLAGRNVGGALPGRGELAQEWIAITAHHDHVGLGRHGGVRPGNRGRMHPGADDNASGTAGVLVLAKMLSEAYAEAPPETDLRSVLFLTFDAEELGLRGSAHFAEHPPVAPRRIAAALNMDMIGRLRGGNLLVLGTQTGEGLEEILRPHFEASGLTVAVSGAGSGMSDDANFHRLEIPALHFFTGLHGQYTSPGDRAHTLNPAGALLVIDLVFDLALDLAARPDVPAFSAPPAGPGRDRGYADVRLGIRPSMSGGADGVLLDGVSTGSSAAEAGMQGGDVIVGWDGDRIRDLGDLMQHLRQHEPGDRVKVTVKRDGDRVELDVTLKASSGRRG